MTRVMILPDIQAPSEDRKLVTLVTRFTRDYAPDAIYCVGDEADSPEPSRWSRGLAGEYAGTLQAGFDRTRAVMSGFREALGDKPFHVMRSNHGDRLRTYCARFSPALSSLRDLRIERQLGYEELDITYHHQPWRFAPGWLLMHGDEGSMTQTAGGTALSLARKTGHSVVCGHTHKLGFQHENNGVNGQPSRSLIGVEAGHLMDVKKASYLKFGGANWQAGFVLLDINLQGRVHPTLVPIINKTFVVDGVTYSA